MDHIHSSFCGCSWVTKFIKKEQDRVTPQPNHITAWLNTLSDTPTLPERTAQSFGSQVRMNSEGYNSAFSQHPPVFGHAQLGISYNASVDVPMVDSHTFTFFSPGIQVNFPLTTSESDSDMSSSRSVVGSRRSSHRNYKHTSRRHGILSMGQGRRPKCGFVVDYEKKKALRRLPRVEDVPKPPPAKPDEHHHSACGCSPRSVVKKNREVLRLEGILLNMNSWGDLKSPSDKAYDFDLPVLPPLRPKHRTRRPVKSCLKKVAAVKFCDDPDSEDSGSDCSSVSSDDSDTDSICHSFDGDNASRTGRMSRFVKEKKAKSVRFGQARCLRTGQGMASTPRTPENDSRKERYKARQVMENKYRKMLAHEEKEAANIELPPSTAFIRQDEEVERCLARAEDISRANERAAIGRGALDFFIFVCRDKNSTGNQICEHLVYRLVKHRGNLSIVGSYHGEEREFANPGTSNVSPVPAHLYRDCRSSMSWIGKDEEAEVDEMDTSF